LHTFIWWALKAVAADDKTGFGRVHTQASARIQGPCNVSLALFFSRIHTGRRIRFHRKKAAGAAAFVDSPRRNRNIATSPYCPKRGRYNTKTATRYKRDATRFIIQPTTIEQRRLSLHRLPPQMVGKRYTELPIHVTTEGENFGSRLYQGWHNQCNRPPLSAKSRRVSSRTELTGRSRLRSASYVHCASEALAQSSRTLQHFFKIMLSRLLRGICTSSISRSPPPPPHTHNRTDTM
jgi:hypothetical protein